MGPIGLILVSALAPAGAAEVAWDTITRLTTNPASQVTGYSGQHSVAVDAGGNVYVAWLDQRIVPYQMWYRRYDAGTRTWLEETELTDRSANCFRSGIACDSSGNVHVLWHTENWQRCGLWAKRYDAATHRWKPDTLIDSTDATHLQFYPSVACVPGSGDVEVAWYGTPDAGGLPQVFSRERHQSSGWDSAMQVTTAPVIHDQVSVATGGDGDIAVVWVGKDFGNDYNQVYCRRRVNGDWQDIELVSDLPNGLTQYSPGVAIDQGGAIHVVWHGRSMMNTYQQVFHRECAAAGWSGIDSISGERAYQQQFPSVASDAAGRCHAVWSSPAGSEHAQLVYGQRDTNGVWSAPMILTGLDSGDVSYPSVACDADSGVHVVWYDASSGNPDIYYLRGVIPGSGAIEERSGCGAAKQSAEATIVRSVSLCRQSGVRLFDACGRSATRLAPGVYFARVPDGSGFRRLVVVQ